MRAVEIAMCMAALLGLAVSDDASSKQHEVADLRFLPEDDECDTAGAEACSFNALQRRAAVKNTAATAGVEVELPTVSSAGIAEEATYACKNCMQANAPPSFKEVDWAITDDADEAALGTTPIRNYAMPCESSCGKKGFCGSYCGAGNACCFAYDMDPPQECKRVDFWPVVHTATCVRVVADVPTTSVETGPLPGPTTERGSNYHPWVRSLSSPSKAPLHTFYMYRGMSNNNYAFENVNAANLAGTLWYLHNEVVSATPRKFAITRLLRIKVQYRAPQPLWDKGMNFGVRFAYDSGKCTGPWTCDNMYGKYGYHIGCNYVTNFPTKQWGGQCHYKDAIWYSLPGPCNNKEFAEHDPSCAARFPGGSCIGEPTGTGDCTYSYESVGEISIDELEGLKDYQWFIKVGGKEWQRWRDQGSGMSFWDHQSSEDASQARINRALALFAQKYPDSPVLPDVPCDFNFGSFYQGEGYAKE